MISVNSFKLVCELLKFGIGKYCEISDAQLYSFYIENLTEKKKKKKRLTQQLPMYLIIIIILDFPTIMLHYNMFCTMNPQRECAIGL